MLRERVGGVGLAWHVEEADNEPRDELLQEADSASDVGEPLDRRRVVAGAHGGFVVAPRADGVAAEHAERQKLEHSCDRHADCRG